MTGVRVRDLHEKWVQSPEYRAAYDAMEDEFVLAAELIEARSRAKLSHGAPAGRLGGPGTAVGGTEGGRYLQRSGPSLVDMAQEKERLSERLARLDADRAKLANQLIELEIAERVLTRFNNLATTERRRRGRPGRTTPAPAAERSRSRAAQQTPAVSLSEATLRAVQAHADGATGSEVLGYLAQEFGMTVKPNHLGIALQRHRRAGRLENRNSRWYPAQLGEVWRRAING